MKKQQILIIFDTKQKSLWFLRDKLMPLMPELKKVSHDIYETDKLTIRLCNLGNDIRGLSASFIFLYDDCTLNTYQALVLPLVKGDHNKIKVVF
jgi:hypothetical protein